MEAQQTLKFRHLNTENGLSQNSVLTIGQDGDGFIWLGTQNGLNRYDGFSFKTFVNDQTDKNSLSNNYVLSILKDAENRLWIGTLNGLNLYHPKTESFTTFNIPFEKNNPRANDINCITEDENHVLWIGTKSGLVNLDPQKKLFTKIKFPNVLDNEERSINDIYIAKNDATWLATSNGLFVLKKKEGNHFSINRIVISGIEEKDSVFCTSIVKGKDETYWVGTLNDGLFHLDSEGKVLHRLNFLSKLDNHIRKILVGKSDKLFVASQNGLFVIDQKTYSFDIYRHKNNDPQSLGKNSLYGLFEDNEGSIWAGSYFGGVSVASKVYSQFHSWPGLEQLKGFESPVISEIAIDKNNTIWMGAEGNGLIHFNPQNKQYEVFQNANSGLSSDLVKALYFDKQQKLWIGTHGAGIESMDIETGSFSRFPTSKKNIDEKRSETYCFNDDIYGHLIYGGNYGIRIASKNNGILDVNSITEISTESCRSLTHLLNGDLLAGTTQGLYLIKNNKTELLCGGININCIVEINAEVLWLGTRSGLFSFNRNTHKIVQLKVGTKAQLNVLSMMKTIGKSIWVSSENGLFEIPINNSLAAKQYLVSDGIANNQFNYNSSAIDKNGFLYFGGNDGLTYFQPKDIISNEHIANLLFTGVSLLDTTISAKEQTPFPSLYDSSSIVQFKYYQSSFSINFALLSFINSDKNHYQYKLIGYDKNWRDTKQPQATFINLPPGYYTLQIRGFNNDNVPSIVKQLTIVVRPPFWQTWWAFSIYFIILTLLILGITRYFFLKALYDREDDLNQQKLRFFTNISHEIRTHLTLIITPLTNLLQKDSSLREHRTLSQIQTNASQLMSLVNELMDFRKVEDNALQLHIFPTKIYPFVIKIYQSFLPIAEINHIDFTYDFTDADTIAVNMDRAQMEKVLFNLLSNAFKFTPQNGKIHIEVRKDSNDIVIAILDNGKQIDPIYREKVFDNYFQIKNNQIQDNLGFGIGLAYTRKIVELHKGKVFVKDADDGIFTKAFCIRMMGISEDSKENDESNITGDIIMSIDRPSMHIVEYLPYDEKKLNLMIVEDNKKIQSLLSDILKKEFNLTIADCAEDAIALLVQNIPDIILSDVMMPGMGGIQFCNKIKQDLHTSHIPIILLTAKNTEDDLIDGLENGADAYLSKPFNTQVLELTIRNLLKRQIVLQNRVTESLDIPEQHGITAVEPKPLEKLEDIETLRPQDQAFLMHLVQFVEQNFENTDLGVQLLTKEFAMSAPILYKKIQALTGYTVHEFIKLQRLKRACELLKDGVHNITEIAYLVGYSDRKYFSKEFKKVYGVTPTAYQGEGLGL